MSSEFQRITGGVSDPPPLLGERGVPNCDWGADAREMRPRCAGVTRFATRWLHQGGEVAMLVKSCPDLLLLWVVFAYGSLLLLARLPASKKPGSDESTRSPRMNPIRKEGVG